MPRRGVKNHLSFTSKNCKVKIHDLLSWAMILHAFCKRTKAKPRERKKTVNMLVSFNCSDDLSIVLQDRSALIKVFDLFSLWAVKANMGQT